METFCRLLLTPSGLGSHLTQVILHLQMRIKYWNDSLTVLGSARDFTLSRICSMYKLMFKRIIDVLCYSTWSKLRYLLTSFELVSLVRYLNNGARLFLRSIPYVHWMPFSTPSPSSAPLSLMSEVFSRPTIGGFCFLALLLFFNSICSLWLLIVILRPLILLLLKGVAQEVSPTIAKWTLVKLKSSLCRRNY